MGGVDVSCLKIRRSGDLQKNLVFWGGEARASP